MKKKFLLAGVLIAFILLLAARSQEIAAVIEPLLKTEANPEVAAAVAEAAVEAPPAVPIVIEAEAPAILAAEAAPPVVVIEIPVPEEPTVVVTEILVPEAEPAAPVVLPAMTAVEEEPVATEPEAALAEVESMTVGFDPVATYEPTTRLTEGQDGLISIDVEEMPIAEIVKLFGKLSGANIIASTTNLTGTVTVSLKNVAWQPAFESILSRHALILTEKPSGSHIYVIESGRAGEAQEPRVTETFHLKYAQADRIANLVNSMLDNRGKATSFPDANAVIIQAPASKISDIKQVVESLDKLRAQVYIEARFVEMSAAASKKLGLKWDSLKEWGASVRGIDAGIEWNKGRSARYNTGTDAGAGVTDYSRTETSISYVQDMSAVPRVVNGALVYPYVAVGTPTYPFQKEVFNTTTLTPSGILGAPGAMRDAENMAWRMARGLSGQLSIDDFRLALSAFEEEDGVSMISNPKIIVANEETAKVDMTTKEPYVEVSFQPATSDNGRDSTSTKLSTIPGKEGMFGGEAFFSYGVTLTVTPRVSRSGVITVTIEPSISDLERYYEVGGTDTAPATRYPIINMKKINTTFSMLDGSTAVIGGLTRSSEGNLDSGIPLLRHIPWIGPRLFGWKSRSKEQREIIIFVTVGIINAEEEMPREVGLPKNAVLTRDFKEPGDLPKEDLMKLKK